MSTAQVTYNHEFIFGKTALIFRSFHYSFRTPAAVSLRVQYGNVRKLAMNRNMLGKRSGISDFLWICVDANFIFGFIPLGTGTTRITSRTKRGENRLGADEALLGGPT